MAAFLQHEERPLLCIATDQVEDHIDFLLTKISSRAIVGVGTSLNTNSPPYSNNLIAFMRTFFKSAQSTPQGARFKLAAPWTLNGVSVSRTLDGGSEVRRHAHLLEHDVERGIAVESLDLAILHIEEVRARNVDLCSCWLDHAGGVSIGPRKVP